MTTDEKTLKPLNLWQRFITLHSVDLVEQRQEYMTKVVVGLVAVLTISFVPVIIILRVLSVFDSGTMLLAFIVAVVSSIAAYIASTQYWKVSSYLPPLIFFLLGIERVISSGLGTSGVISFVLAILLSAMLVSKSLHWFMVAGTIAALIIITQFRLNGQLPPAELPEDIAVTWIIAASLFFLLIGGTIDFFRRQFQLTVSEVGKYNLELENLVAERTAALEESIVERERLHEQIVQAQRETIRELATPVIPIIEGVLVMPLIGAIDTARAQDVTRAVLAGISQHNARVVILDVTGVQIIDTAIAQHLGKTIQVARLKGANVIITGISDAVAESIIDLGLDWGNLETFYNLQSAIQVVIKNGPSQIYQ
jgi:anti-anti-sigma regulatory factor